MNNLTVATVASHSALQILRAAKKAGFKTAGLSLSGVSSFYKRFGFIDDVFETKAEDVEKLAPLLKS
ncbi:MAG: DUF1246 domain-containing protein, partial [Candidatus Caldarchaeum sp.]|nr:DUF1246 domain-containing protein [Candidatus Caldarchaeum sp.]